MSYGRTVKWAAFNDNPTDKSALFFEDIRSLVTVRMAADQFGITPEQVAISVLKIRQTPEWAAQFGKTEPA